MKWLFDSADRFCAQCTWKDFALVKFCLCAVGIIIGVLLPVEVKKTALWVAMLVFAVTYIVLMSKYFRILFNRAPENQASEKEES